jgi:hypothetical protein
MRRISICATMYCFVQTAALAQGPDCDVYCAKNFLSIQDAINTAASVNGAVFIPGSVSPTSTSWMNPEAIPILDFRYHRLNVGDQFNPSMAYLGFQSTNPFNVTKDFYTGPNNVGAILGSAIRADTNALSGGIFNLTQQSAYASLMTNTKMVTAGQALGWFHYNQGLGDGNTMGQNLVQECWGGTGVTQAQCTGIGEEDISEGSSQPGHSNFEGTVVGSPNAGATKIMYQAAQPDAASRLGQRPLFNQNHQTTAGMVTALSSSIINTNDTFTFSGSSSWEPGAPACGNVAATSCDPTGEYVKLGSEDDFYPQPCKGDDVDIDGHCVGHWYRVSAVISKTELQIDTAYDNINLAHSFPAVYDLIQGAELTEINTASNTVTLPPNSYQWSNADLI